jgi:hypothetical protein
LACDIALSPTEASRNILAPLVSESPEAFKLILACPLLHDRNRSSEANLIAIVSPLAPFSSRRPYQEMKFISEFE